jgi:hypothetical protein
VRTADPAKAQRIIQAAIQLFAERPYHEVRMDDVAERAKVAKGTLYVHFKDVGGAGHDRHDERDCAQPPSSVAWRPGRASYEFDCLRARDRCSEGGSAECQTMGRLRPVSAQFAWRAWSRVAHDRGPCGTRRWPPPGLPGHVWRGRERSGRSRGRAATGSPRATR